MDDKVYRRVAEGAILIVVSVFILCAYVPRQTEQRPGIWISIILFVGGLWLLRRAFVGRKKPLPPAGRQETQGSCENRGATPTKKRLFAAPSSYRSYSGIDADGFRCVHVECDRCTYSACIRPEGNNPITSLFKKVDPIHLRHP